MPAGFRLLMPPDASVPDDLQAWLLLNPGALTARRAASTTCASSAACATASRWRRRAVRSTASRRRSRASTPTTAPPAASTTRSACRPTASGRSGRRCWRCSAASAILLLIACVNVAEPAGRARGHAARARRRVRMSLGAGSGRLVRQCLVEGLMLAVLGAAAGVLVGHWGLQFLLALAAGRASSGSARRGSIGRCWPSPPAIAGMWGVLFSLAPLAEVFRGRSLTEALQQDGRRCGRRHPLPHAHRRWSCCRSR